MNSSGLSTNQAINKLISDISDKLTTKRCPKNNLASAIKTSLNPRVPTSVFPLTPVIAAIILIGLLTLAGYYAECVIIAALTLINAYLGVRERFLTQNEMRQRIEHVLNRLKEVSPRLDWPGPQNYPHLHTPLTASVILQWTIRDREQVNLPWALLVKGDLIMMKPGQSAPGLCHSVDDPQLTMKGGETLYVKNREEDPAAVINNVSGNLIQRFSEVPDQSGMAVLSITPENPLLGTFLMEIFNLGIAKMSLFPNPLLPKTFL